ncbi:MAG TPA: hypothetical protein VH855_29635 [Acetobacteraceae bacterium]|jgi:hypothetical protein
MFGDAIFNRMWTLLHVPCSNVQVCNPPVGVTLGRAAADRCAPVGDRQGGCAG